MYIYIYIYIYIYYYLYIRIYIYTHTCAFAFRFEDEGFMCVKLARGFAWARVTRVARGLREAFCERHARLQFLDKQLLDIQFFM